VRRGKGRPGDRALPLPCKARSPPARGEFRSGSRPRRRPADRRWASRKAPTTFTKTISPVKRGRIRVTIEWLVAPLGYNSVKQDAATCPLRGKGGAPGGSETDPSG
jgi:hypothetical protein